MKNLDFKGLDRVVHSPAHLAVLTALHVYGSQDFPSLVDRLSFADTVEPDLEVLLRHRYIGLSAASYHLTLSGREALQEYTVKMKAIVEFALTVPPTPSPHEIANAIEAYVKSPIFTTVSRLWDEDLMPRPLRLDTPDSATP